MSEGCHLCNYMGCDDCMFETKVIEYCNTKLFDEPLEKKKIIIKDTDMRLRRNRPSQFKEEGKVDKNEKIRN